MARPKKKRHLSRLPEPVIYVPAGSGADQPSPMEVGLDDFEVMRLVDARGYTIVESAQQLGVSKSTAGRMLQRCRRAVAQAMEARAPIFLDAGEGMGIAVADKGEREQAGRGQVVKSGYLAVACYECTAGSQVSRIFGRTPGFMLLSQQGELLDAVKNPGFRAKRDAAKAAADLLKSLNVKTVVAGKFGEAALNALSGMGIRAVVATGLTVSEAIDYLKTEKNG